MVFKLNVDRITGYIYKALDILFLMRPEKTAYGSILGAIFLGFKDSICGVLSDKMAKFVIDMQWYAIFLLGVFIVRIDILFYREPLDKEILGKLNSLKRIINESNLTETEKRQKYRQLINSAIEKESIVGNGSASNLTE